MLLWPLAARAQTPPSPPVLDSVRAARCTLGCETVRGLVYDSLLAEPLGDAMVVAQSGGVFASTDSLGRFELIHDGPTALLTAYHTALEQSGLGALQAERPALDEPWDNVTLATPSLLTIWPKLCGEERPTMFRTRILTGTARLDDGVTRVAGARIFVQQPRPPFAFDGSDLRQAESITDSLGNYLVCGIEEAVAPSVVTLSAEAQSGVLQVPASVSPVHRLDLVLGRMEALPGVLQGQLIDPDRKPVAGMYVTVDGGANEVVTGQDGRFRFAAVPTGSRMLNVRGIGFAPLAQTVEVTGAAMPPLTIMLSEFISLTGVVVTANVNIRREYAEFEWRRRAGLARFVDSTTIANAPNVRAAIQMIPGIEVRSRDQRATLDFEIRGRRDYVPSLFSMARPPKSVCSIACPRKTWRRWKFTPPAPLPPLASPMGSPARWCSSGPSGGWRRSGSRFAADCRVALPARRPATRRGADCDTR